MPYFNNTSDTKNTFVGQPLSWAIDFGFIGVIAASVAYWRDLTALVGHAAVEQLSFDIIGTLGTHGALGMLMGAGLCAGLEYAHGRLKFHSLWPIVLSTAAFWGGASLLISRTFFFSLSWDMGGQELQHFLALVLGGAGFGAVVYGPLWALYTVVSVFQARGRRLLVLLSVVTAAFAAPISRFLMQLIQG